MLKSRKFLLIIVILTLNLTAGEKGWKPLPWKSYKPTDYHLKKGVEYLETRIYKTNADYSEIIDDNYKVIYKMYRKPLKRFDKETVHQFRKIGPNLKLAKETDIHKSSYVDAWPWDKKKPRVYTIGGAFFTPLYFN